MSTYSETITMTVPAALAAVAAAVGRAMDPDVGGAQSFRHPVTGYDAGGTPILDASTLTTTTACTPGFKAQAIAMLAAPALLFAACQADYAMRWPGFEPPSLDDCQAFCAALQIE